MEVILHWEKVASKTMFGKMRMKNENEYFVSIPFFFFNRNEFNDSNFEGKKI